MKAINANAEIVQHCADKRDSLKASDRQRLGALSYSDLARDQKRLQYRTTR
jgi:hypothetical protein